MGWVVLDFCQASGGLSGRRSTPATTPELAAWWLVALVRERYPHPFRWSPFWTPCGDGDYGWVEISGWAAEAITGGAPGFQTPGDAGDYGGMGWVLLSECFAGETPTCSLLSRTPPRSRAYRC